MKMKDVLAAILTAVLCISGNLWAYSGGDGSAGNPYQISSVADWQTLMATSADWNQKFILTTTIDLAGVTVTPIGDVSNYFSGVFNGNGFTICNALINQPGNHRVGLFGYVSTTGQIKNLGMVDVNIQGQYSVGALVGDNSGTLTNCYSTGSAGGLSSVGGLVGDNSGTLTNCCSTSSVTGVHAGGLVGDNSGMLTNCYSTGLVSGTISVGGLVGNNSSGTIISCYATGPVTGSTTVGGLVGDNSSGTIISCYAAGPVNGVMSVGGLAGDNSSGTLTNCYSTGLVSGVINVGGLVGDNSSGTLTFCFWDTQTSGQSVGVGSGSSTGVTGETTTDMKTLATFTTAGWDFSTTDGDPADWIMQTNCYPRLAWESYGGGRGTSAIPYQIWTPEQMNMIGTNSADWDKHYKLMTDIDMSMYTGVQYNIIGNTTTNFTGTFNGNRHIIYNLTYATTAVVDYVGLFGYTTNAAIFNLGVENILISSGGNYIGGLIGYKEGTLINCHATGSVIGTGSRIGGLVGGNNHGMLSGCYAAGSVTGTGTRVGGLVGENFYDTITDCYATSSVSGNIQIGGLIGFNYSGMLTNCYATGLISSTGTPAGGFVGYHSSGPITACFWDMQASGRSVGIGYGISAGVIGKSTIEMKKLSTFTSAGWDFIRVWSIGQHQTYPYVRTQLSADLNNDDTVDLADFVILAQDWLERI